MSTIVSNLWDAIRQSQTVRTVSIRIPRSSVLDENYASADQITGTRPAPDVPYRDDDIAKQLDALQKREAEQGTLQSATALVQALAIGTLA